MTKLQGWFSRHPESLREQEVLVHTLEHAGYDLSDIVSNTKKFKFNDARERVEKAAKKAYQDNMPWARGGSPTQQKFVKKQLGNWFEYLAQAVVNSRRFALLLPSGWVSSRHRCEFGIPDLECGSPDRLIFDENGRFHSAMSCKLYGDHSKVPDNLERAGNWANDKAGDYAEVLGIDPELRIKTSYFSDAKNKRTINWRGGMVCADTKGSTVEDLLSRNTAAQREFWRDFFAELKHNVTMTTSAFSEVLGTHKRPDAFQHERLVRPVHDHVGPGIINGACGIGKTVAQMACIENRRGISLYMPGIRLALASQANDEMTKCFGFPTHRVYVMSRQEWHSGMEGRDLHIELSHNATDPMDLARLVFKYVQNGDPIPLIIVALEPSLIKVARALEIIRDGQLTGTDGELMPWAGDPEKVRYWWKRVCELLLDAHYDEAHNLVTGDRKGDDEKEVSRKTEMIGYLIWMNGLWRRSIYWTATLKRNGSRYDMTNPEIFGQVIGCVRPKEAIDRGYIVPLLLIPVRLSVGQLIKSGLDSNDVDTDHADRELTYYVRAIEDAHQRCRALGIACRLIIFTNGTTYHVSFRQRIKEHFQKRDLPQIWCEFVQASTDANSRKNLFSEFASHDFSVLLNHNIVGEGINIETCSGVILGRQMNAVSLIQALGRPCRLHPHDRDRLKTGDLRPGDWPNYLKPYGLGYTYVDEYSADSLAGEESLIDLLYQMREVNDGETWWIGPDEALNIKPRGKTPAQYSDPQKNEDQDDTDHEANYDQGFAGLLILDTSDTQRIASKLNFWKEIENLDMSDDDDFERLVAMLP